MGSAECCYHRWFLEIQSVPGLLPVAAVLPVHQHGCKQLGSVLVIALHIAVCAHQRAALLHAMSSWRVFNQHYAAVSEYAETWMCVTAASLGSCNFIGRLLISAVMSKQYFGVSRNTWLNIGLSQTLTYSMKWCNDQDFIFMHQIPSQCCLPVFLPLLLSACQLKCHSQGLRAIKSSHSGC